MKSLIKKAISFITVTALMLSPFGFGNALTANAEELSTSEVEVRIITTTKEQLLIGASAQLELEINPTSYEPPNSGYFEVVYTDETTGESFTDEKQYRVGGLETVELPVDISKMKDSSGEITVDKLTVKFTSDGAPAIFDAYLHVLNSYGNTIHFTSTGIGRLTSGETSTDGGTSVTPGGTTDTTGGSEEPGGNAGTGTGGGIDDDDHTTVTDPGDEIGGGGSSGGGGDGGEDPPIDPNTSGNVTTDDPTVSKPGGSGDNLPSGNNNGDPSGNNNGGNNNFNNYNENNNYNDNHNNFNADLNNSGFSGQNAGFNQPYQNFYNPLPQNIGYYNFVNPYIIRTAPLYNRINRGIYMPADIKINIKKHRDIWDDLLSLYQGG
jgi:hypothetical protein